MNQSFSRSLSRGSSKSFFGSSRSQVGSESSSPPSSAESSLSSSASSVPTLSKPAGMGGMAAAFDLLLQNNPAASSTVSSTPQPPPLESSGTLQERYDALQRLYEDLQRRYALMEHRALAAEARLSSSSSSFGGVTSLEGARARLDIGQIPQTSTVATMSSSPTTSSFRAVDHMEDEAVERLERSWMSRANTYSYGDWRFTRMPGRSLVARCDAYLIETGDGLMDTLPSGNAVRLSEPSLNVSYYTDFMSSIKHQNFVGVSGIGAFADIPVVISCETVAASRTQKPRRRPVLCLVRDPNGSEQICLSGFDSVIANLPYEAQTFQDFLQTRFPNCKFKEVTAPDAHASLTKKLQQFESMNIVNTYKFGVLRWITGQTENEAMANGTSPEFTDFLQWLGERIELRGWTRFRGGLNVRDNVTGTHSYYTTLPSDNIEIMFHVSTELPFSDSDAQCLERKRHLGNDVVLIIFWEGDGEFDPTMIKSQFNHVFIVVSLDTSSIPELGKIRYRVNVTCKQGIPRWEPYLPYPPVFDRDDVLRTWLLYKCCNGERATMYAPVFRTKLIKTNTTFLKQLVDEFSSP